jgi:hypothetical protein
MQIPRTPDSRFEGLKGYDFAPHYTGIADAGGIGRWLAALDLKGLTLLWQGWGGDRPRPGRQHSRTVRPGSSPAPSAYRPAGVAMRCC